ncbi:MAG TPA: M1 family aminopeptidase [Candidatus Angelobacter sp.]|nr:M1 family aminopeptidase [Candidatus Angelobacter sp.]
MSKELPFIPGLRLISFLLLSVLLLSMPFVVRADTITGTVKDPSGGVVPGARIEITGDGISQPIIFATDESGKFAAMDLKPGQYSVRVTKDGFEPLVSAVELHGTFDLQLKLVIAEQITSVTVSEKSLAFANSDSAYRQLRGIGFGDTFVCENYKFNMDVGNFELKTGTLTFLAPVNGIVTGAIFVGEGHFTLKPIVRGDINEMQRRSGGPTAEEDFSRAVFRFTGRVYNQITASLVTKVATPPTAEEAFRHWKEKIRRRREVPEGFTEAILTDATIDNVDADVLSAVYNPKHPQFFNAYMVGSPHKDLRYFVRIRTGAIPQLDSPEEVALINVDGGGMNDGIWYSEHLASELSSGKASSNEDKRLFATKHYTIETVIGKNNHFFSRSAITFSPLLEGERVLKFGLLPTLRVTRVSDENGKDLHFIQENRKEDGSFYAILDEALPVGKDYTITIEYAGDKVLYDAGGGSYYVGARESWYPNLNGFGEKALYDLTFKVPKNNVVISVGKQQSQSTEEGFAVSHWVTPSPVTVAGFNYGQYQKMDFPDDITHYSLSGYYLTELPSSLARFRDGPLGAMAPHAMTKYALDQARAQMQLCTFYFGKAPYENVAITEQPNFNFGQSWPSLVYLPISAYIDSTQRWMLFGHIDNNFTGFVQEVTPHEVAHQWFGHSVMWASYHDQWLSEGFADFAAALFLQQAVGPKWQKDYQEYWDRQKRRVLDKNNFGVAPNDAGPLWLGLRLISPKSSNAYQGLTYSKGAFVLSMLRSMMRADQAPPGDRDKTFIDMMHDFIESHRETSASTESFKAIVEKHMTKEMDLQKNGRLDWFFNEWVYGTEIPRYDLKYETASASGGVVKIKVQLTQSEVDNNFAMIVPIFGDFGNGMIRLAQIPIVGDSTRTVILDMDKQPKKIVLNAYKDMLER